VPVPLAPVLDVVLVLVPSAGSVSVTTSCWPDFSPLAISVLKVPRRPTITCWLTCLPFSSSVTVPVDPVPVTASFGTVTPSAWSMTTEALALIPGRTSESVWSIVSVTS
jgi:hypothetical protein